jgi:tRNA pseudouridine55 synthase
MAKKQWQAVDGIVLLNKPEGVTSNGILQQVRRLYNAKKAGHTGALDPFATGLLPLCFGEATKISGLLLDSDKRYIATLSLGVETDSGDKDGNPLQTVTVPTLNAESIQTVLKGFEGDIMQVPPMYSALKHQGIPLYEYARKGVEVERVPRPVTIHELTLIDFHPTEITFEVFCSKGTYVRTLGEEIAKALDTLGHLTALHRTQTGSLRGDDMATVAEIEQDLTGHLQRWIYPCST